MTLSPQTLTVEDRRIVASWAADCAEHVLGIFDDAAPDDTRGRDAIRFTLKPGTPYASPQVRPR
ncbi:hypothetical protein GWK18_12330 [Kocuria sp. JC486]|uniref:putative immunity protein n=1 Tax=Kocuria sp. JC486 TaxID=1970736 RepID=UPI00141ECBDB|nr:hypothetical protein [Kocuria sp. JC486]NHU86346.1 hypothetical protein [Kocuria sp. JC486]